LDLDLDLDLDYLFAVCFLRPYPDSRAGLKELFASDGDGGAEVNGGIWKDNAYSIEHRFQSLVNNLERRGEENAIDRLTALV
jgi:hypothetical protein